LAIGRPTWGLHYVEINSDRLSIGAKNSGSLSWGWTDQERFDSAARGRHFMGFGLELRFRSEVYVNLFYPFLVC
jgi:hypothetical protein